MNKKFFFRISLLISLLLHLIILFWWQQENYLIFENPTSNHILTVKANDTVYFIEDFLEPLNTLPNIQEEKPFEELEDKDTFIKDAAKIFKPKITNTKKNKPKIYSSIKTKQSKSHTHTHSSNKHSHTYNNSVEKESLVSQADYLKNIPPSYPEEARRRQIEGKVLLKVYLSNTGLVQKLKIKKSSGHEILDHEAMHSVINWKFTPAKHNNNPIESVVLVPIRFRLGE